jgi:hypothetical protein
VNTLMIDSLLLPACVGSSLLLLGAVSVWRVGIEFERAWLRALEAPPSPSEEALFARMRATSGVSMCGATRGQTGARPDPSVGSPARERPGEHALI